MWSSYASATALSTAKNYIMKSDSAFTHTYRAYIKTAEYGQLKLKFWYSNRVDSTWADGFESRADLPGGLWKVESAYIADGGRVPGGSVVDGTQVPVTFDSSVARQVMPGETFWSDAADITDPGGALSGIFVDDHDTRCRRQLSLQYGSTIGACLRRAQGTSPVKRQPMDFGISANCLVLPDFIGCEREGARRLAFLW